MNPFRRRAPLPEPVAIPDGWQVQVRPYLDSWHCRLLDPQGTSQPTCVGATPHRTREQAIRCAAANAWRHQRRIDARNTPWQTVTPTATEEPA